jgi:hypothetical protein
MQTNYRHYIKLSSYTIENTALDAGISLRQLKRYLTGETLMPDDKALALAHILGQQAATMPFEHFTNTNPIGQNLYPAPLNNIERTFPAFLYKAAEEQSEMIEALNEMCRLVLNNRDLDVEESEDFDNLFGQVLDVEQLCLEIKIKYAEIRGLDALRDRVAEHKEKCIAYGYHIEKERPALIKERAANKYVCRHYNTELIMCG